MKQANTVRIDKSLEFNDSEFDFESLCGATPTLEDTLIELEDELFWDAISDKIEEENKPASNEDARNIFAAAGFKLSQRRNHS